MNPTISPTINPVTPAPIQPSGAITPITQQQATPITGQSIPTVGTSEYNKAQSLTATPAKTPVQQQPQQPTQSQLLNKQLADIGNEYKTVSSDYQNALVKANETLDGIRTGSVPLSGYEQAQLDATRQAMQQVINEQRLENKNFEQGIRVANEARGLSRYSPEMAQGEIFAAVSEGNKKISDLNSKMVLTLSDMERGFRDNNFNKVKEAFQFIKEAKEEKTATLDNMYKTVVSKQQALEKDRQEQAMADVSSLLIDDSYTLPSKKQYISQLIASGALNQEQIKEVNTMLKESTKDIEAIAKSAAENGATPAQINAILKSESINDAYNNASGFLSKVDTGAIGEYKYYEAQERRAGRAPLSFLDFKNYKGGGGVDPEAEDKLRKEYLDRSEVKAYQRARGAYDRLNAIVPDRTDATYLTIAGDEAALKGLIRQEAILTDPSATRITEDGSVIESDSLSGIVEQRYNALTKDQKTLPIKVKQLVNNADKTFGVSRKGAEEVQKEIGALAKKRGIEVDLPGVFNPGAKLSANEDTAVQSLQKFREMNPDKQQEVANKMDIFEKTTGREVTASEFLQVFPEYKGI